MVKKSSGSQGTEAAFVNAARTKARAYLRLPNVTSVGVGYRVKGGEVTDELTLQFTVERKLAPEALALEQLPALPTSIVSEDGIDRQRGRHRASGGRDPAFLQALIPDHRRALSDRKQPARGCSSNTPEPP